VSIECTNCGGSDLQFYVTLGALIVAALALGMNYVQFREFLRKARARARFEVSLRTVNSDHDGVLRTNANRCAARVEIEIKNAGDRAAGETIVNVLVPREQDLIRWCGPNGEELEEDFGGTASRSDILVGTDGRRVQSKCIQRKLERVGIKPTRLLHFQFNVEVPSAGQAAIPIRVRVAADEMPDEVEYYPADHLLRVARH
jgi:hypothetical protein